MEKKNTLLLTVIAIATLLVAVVGATFAYFATTIQNEGVLNVNAVTDPAASIFLSEGESINLSITSENMARTVAGNIAAADSDVLTVTYGSSKADYATNCLYDIVFAWDESSPNKYLYSENTHPTRTNETANIAPWYSADEDIKYEFSITVGDATVTGSTGTGSTVTGMAEKNIAYDGSCSLTEYTNQEECEDNEGEWADAGHGYMMLVQNAEIKSSEVYGGSCSVEAEANTKEACDTAGGEWTTTGTVVSWPITVNFYNLNTNQNHLANATYLGKVQVVNVRCN